MDVPLPWERLIWSGRPGLLARLGPASGDVRYCLTDLRLVVVRRGGADELILHDIGDVEQRRLPSDRIAGTSTLVVHARDARLPPMTLRGIRRGAQLAALVEILSGDPLAVMDPESARAALEWTPRLERSRRVEAFAAVAVMLLASIGARAFMRHRPAPIAYAADDAIYPGGVRRSPEAIAGMMRREVMPWARSALAPIVGGADRVSCETCHGRNPESRAWKMPAVAALPQPEVRARGWERYSAGMDAQMRNAIYGYSADPAKQQRADYMRHVVLPGMARLLHRPAYDFTKSYDYNRERNALGCYHCHTVKQNGGGH
ncbi:MAG: hypothetical protein ACM3SQ_07810 [Betaproteobacteria bacterium]